jgi:hypothetical protein
MSGSKPMGLVLSAGEKSGFLFECSTENTMDGI